MRQPRELLPLANHDFQVLLTLAEAPCHAYGLVKAVEQQEGGVPLEIGSLYRILARLMTEGVIEDLAPAADAEGHGARRRTYRLTTFGRKVAEAEVARLQAVLRTARRNKLAPAKGSR